MKRLDSFKKKISENRLPVGTHIKTNDSTIVEFFGLAGLDFVWIDGEHPAMNIETVQHHVITAQGTGMAAFYRVPWNDPVLVKPILDMGADGIIFPMIRTRQDAELAVSSCRYPPKGIRGMGPIRDNYYGLLTAEQQLQNAENVWKIMQIEHVEAVDHLEEIMDVEGVDALTVGPSDLSASMNLPGQTEHPDVLRKLDELAAKACRANMPFSISTNYNPAVIEKWMERGATWLVVGGEYDFMNVALKRFRSELTDILEKQNR